MCLPNENEFIYESEDEIVLMGDQIVNEWIMIDDDDTVAEQPPPPPPPEQTSFTAEEIRIIRRNATNTLLNNIKATLRFLRVDIHRLEEQNPETSAILIASRIRIEDMERMIDLYEDNHLIRLSFPARELVFET